ncbi:MAG TPA: glycosyltransferase, partial [Patescibacteria group bacterium]|nr:glycosyltransferase [Patescibacteria group bacterium]
EYDLVISVTSESAKGIITKPHTRHISIILTPTRYIWSGYKDYFNNTIFRILTSPVVAYLRFWDKIAANRPDQLIAISTTVQSRIKKYYDLNSEIIYPPLMIRNRLPLKGKEARIGKGARSSSPKNETGLVTEKRFSKKYFLVVSRLVPYKRVDIAIKAANKLKIPLKIIGTGGEFANLKKMAGPTVEFLKYVNDADLKLYYENCKALIFPGVEDFGLTMVEAQAFGKPVIAYRAGGALDILLEGKTGVFFDQQNYRSLSEVLKKFRPSRYNGLDCKRNARRFSYEQFKKQIVKMVE